MRVFLSRYRGYATCPDCGGTRLRAEARAVKIAGRSITEVCQMTVKEARPFFAALQLTESESAIVELSLSLSPSSNPVSAFSPLSAWII